MRGSTSTSGRREAESDGGEGILSVQAINDLAVIIKSLMCLNLNISKSCISKNSESKKYALLNFLKIKKGHFKN